MGGAASGFEGQWGLITVLPFPQNGKQKLHFGRCTQRLVCTRTLGKSRDSIEAWARPTCWSWKGPQGKAGVAVAHTGGGGMGEYSLESGDCYFDTKTWPHLTACRHPVLGCGSPNNQHSRNTGPLITR